MQRYDVAVTLQLSGCADHIEAGADPYVINGWILWDGLPQSQYD